MTKDQMAGIPTDRNLHAHHPRPHMQAQHASSVPSTPSQQAHDMRFHSRSPSPNRALINHSPRSVISDAVGQAGPESKRSAPVVCKFESGAEFRSRRFAYAEGGQFVLEPPAIEPKVTLQPDEEDKLSGDMRELYDRLLPTQESEQRRAQLLKKLDRLMNDEWPGNDIRVNVFGSSGNLLSSSDSDVDVCITTSLRKLESMHSLATLLHKHGMEKVECRASAKVPIVKCWDPELRLACDLNVNNTLALENTRMIKTYVQLDDRVRPLAKIIKYWTKKRILNDAAYGGCISSYTWICMIISFLQRREPPILPSLQKVEGKRVKRDRPEVSKFADDVEALRGCGDANKETLPQLLFNFFRHYGYEFDFESYVVSVREGRLVTREEKGWRWSDHWEKEAQKRLCVEEPFTANRNLGNSADEYSWSGIHNELRRAFGLLADGQQLKECCEQYEFPPVKESVFQRPTPKPAPTLRRSASQSGRASHETNPGRSRKSNNRNQSAQRAGNRRASSGASFTNQRMQMPFQSPPVGTSAMDYFANKGNIHDQLFQQYQYYQLQKDALMAQLLQQQQQQQQQQQHHGRGPGQQQGRVGELTGSPQQQNAVANGLPSPRFQDNPPQTAPLLPGYLYHYPARYPPPSPMTQSRSREGTSTNPSSPSLVAAMPVLRRQINRTSLPDGSSGSLRSQSQPGRSHPLTLNHQAHPGYDFSGAIPVPYNNMRPAQMYVSGQPSMQVPFSPLNAMHSTAGSIECAMPKEYVGYYVQQSPQLVPQQYATSNPMQVPPMILRDPPPQRPRRITPDDLMPPIPNGRHASRSPSPLGHLRSYSTISDMRSRAQSEMMHAPSTHERIMPGPAPAPVPIPTDLNIGGPLIVNGSNRSVAPKPVDTNGAAPSVHGDIPNGSRENKPSGMRTVPLRTADLDQPEALERTDPSDRVPLSPQTSPNPKAKSTPRLSLPPNGTNHVANGLPEQFHDPLTHIAPLLSPVAELRTPSPTHVFAFDEQESPQASGYMKIAQIAHAKQAGRGMQNGLPVPSLDTNHERWSNGSAATSSTKLTKSPTALTPTSANQNPWLQATGKKGHKKSKSSVNYKGPQAPPANASERKGG